MLLILVLRIKRFLYLLLCAHSRNGELSDDVMEYLFNSELNERFIDQEYSLP